MCMSVLFLYVCVPDACLVPERSEEGVGPLELELQYTFNFFKNRVYCIIQAPGPK